MKPAAGQRRPEVQGLRALAVVMVVLYHVWLGRVSGGVDVFLLISSFLLTLSFVGKVESGRPLQLLKYWLGLFRRLVPAAAVVLTAVLGATALLAPPSRWPAIFDQTWASLLYVQNWELASSAVDYYARDDSNASPLQHFWSLSIQGQVFLLWPLLFAAAAVAARAAGLRYRAVLIGVFGAVFALSLAFSIWQTGANQSAAYFDTRSRLWEFALGSLLALLLPYARFGSRARVVLGWFGLAAMLSCGLLLQVQQQFPGWIALWPTLAAACLIAAGRTGNRYGVDRLLSAAPLVRLGDNSYALYLWHWPVLVFWLMTARRPEAGLLDGALVIAASLLLAFATTRCIEVPLRSWTWPSLRRRRTGVLVAAALAVVAVPLSGWELKVQAQEQAAQAQTTADNPGALALTPGFTYSGSEDAVPLPLASSLGSEWADYDRRCEGALAPADPLIESCLQTGNAEAPERTVLVLGDSHAQMWMTAVGAMATERNWNAVLVHKPSCRFGAESPSQSPECNAYNAAVLDYALELAPDAVLTLGSKTDWSSPKETVPDGFAAGMRPFLERGIEVVALRDTPRFLFDMAECIELNPADPDACALPRSELFAPVSPLLRLHKDHPGIGVMDLTDQLCTATDCPGLTGKVLVYMDRDHLTKTYVKTLQGAFTERFLAVTGW